MIIKRGEKMKIVGLILSVIGLFGCGFLSANIIATQGNYIALFINAGCVGMNITNILWIYTTWRD